MIAEALTARMQLARRLAREAGDVLMSHYGRLSGYERKGVIDLVTAADTASEALLVEGIAEAFEADAILAEEGEGRAGNSGFRWVLDPLDGTTNFVHGFPFFMVSIGLLHGDRRVGGVCYGPVLDELFEATAGGGATCNGAPIAVSRADGLGASLVATGFPYDRREILDELLPLVGRAIQTTHGIRRCGAATYDLCLVASGRLDGFFERGLKPWDLCAGSLIVEEAGGRLSAYSGDFDLFGASVVASNGRIHEELLRRVIAGDEA